MCEFEFESRKIQSELSYQIRHLINFRIDTMTSIRLTASHIQGIIRPSGH